MPASGNSVASETTMALPVAVARCSWNRVDRGDQVFAVDGRQLHHLGACRRRRRCRPSRVRGSSARKALAASCAATSRLGWTSVARMLPDTSIARMMVCWCDGSVTTAIGRAAASSIATMASRNSSGGMWRAQALAGAHRLAHDRQAGVAQRQLLLAPQQPAGRAAPAAARPAAARGIRARGSHVAGHAVAFRRPVAGAPAVAAAGASAAAALAHVGEAHHRVDQVVVGGQFQRVDAGCAQAPARSSASRCGGDAREALAKAGVVRVDEQLLAGLGVPHRHQAEVGQLAAPAGRAAAPPPPRGAAPAGASGFSQPGSLMKSDTTNTVERRWISAGGRVRAGRPAGSVPRLVGRVAGRALQRCAAGAARGGGRCAAG